MALSKEQREQLINIRRDVNTQALFLQHVAARVAIPNAGGDTVEVRQASLKNVAKQLEDVSKDITDLLEKAP